MIVLGNTSTEVWHTATLTFHFGLACLGPQKGILSSLALVIFPYTLLGLCLLGKTGQHCPVLSLQHWTFCHHIAWLITSFVWSILLFFLSKKHHSPMSNALFLLLSLVQLPEPEENWDVSHVAFRFSTFLFPSLHGSTHFQHVLGCSSRCGLCGFYPYLSFFISPKSFQDRPSADPSFNTSWFIAGKPGVGCCS